MCDGDCHVTFWKEFRQGIYVLVLHKSQDWTSKCNEHWMWIHCIQDCRPIGIEVFLLYSLFILSYYRVLGEEKCIDFQLILMVKRFSDCNNWKL